jgi:hypothetical protein
MGNMFYLAFVGHAARAARPTAQISLQSGETR